MTLSELAAVLIEAEKTGRPLEMNSLGNRPDVGWCATGGDCLWLNMAYRVKPEPPKPREWWILVYPDGEVSHPYDTPAEAARVASGWMRVERLHVREVFDA